MHTLRYLHMLGPMQILHGGQSPPLKYNKARGLLAYLAQQPGFHTRNTLADLLWPGDSAQGGRDKLKRMLFHVREAMGDAAIEATRQVVRLDPSGHVWHDTQTFAALIEEGRQGLSQATQATDRATLKSGLEALCRAVDLYRGPFMQGLMLDDAPEFENWLAGQREDYASRRIYALRLLADGYRQLGDIESAIHHARQLVALVPRDEAASHHLIALLGQTGQRNEAAAELARLRDALPREPDSPGARIDASFIQGTTAHPPPRDDTRLFPMYWGLWLGSCSWADFGRSVALAHTLVRIATARGDPAWRAHAHAALGGSLCCHGDFAGAARALETAVSVFRRNDASPGLGEDALVTAWSVLSCVRWLLGRHDEALVASDAALARAREVGQPHSLLFALAFAATLRRWRQEVAAAESLATETVHLAREFGLALWEAAGQTIRGWARAQRGDRAGIDEIATDMRQFNGIAGGAEIVFLGHLVEACAAVGETGIGMHIVERALQVSRKRVDRHWVPEFLRAKAEMLLAAGHSPAEGRRWLVRALQAARGLDSPSLLLRAAASLARHDLAAGQDAAGAIGALSHALSRISGGHELHEIRAARELLRIGVRAP